MVNEVYRRIRGAAKPIEGRAVPSICAGELKDWAFGVGAHDPATNCDGLLADRELFPEGMRPPTGIRWSKPGARNWGCYRFGPEDMVVNVLLDSEETGPEVLSFLVFHELLHHEQKPTDAYLGPRNHLMHGPDFTLRERQHPSWERANMFLHTFHERFFEGG